LRRPPKPAVRCLRSRRGVRVGLRSATGNRVPGESWVAGSNPALSASSFRDAPHAIRTEPCRSWSCKQIVWFRRAILTAVMRGGTVGPGLGGPAGELTRSEGGIYGAPLTGPPDRGGHRYRACLRGGDCGRRRVDNKRGREERLTEERRHKERHSAKQ